MQHPERKHMGYPPEKGQPPFENSFEGQAGGERNNPNACKL